MVSKAELVSGAYIIISGTKKNEGVVIDRLHSKFNTIR